MERERVMLTEGEKCTEKGKEEKSYIPADGSNLFVCYKVVSLSLRSDFHRLLRLSLLRSFF